MLGLRRIFAAALLFSLLGWLLLPAGARAEAGEISVRLMVKVNGEEWKVVEVADEAAESELFTLQAQPQVSDAYYERIYETAVVPNDPQFSDQYGLQNISEHLAGIRAPAAWGVTVGSSDTTIAIVDGGVDIAHEDLQGRLWQNTDEVPGNSVDDDGNGFVDDVWGWNFADSAPIGQGVLDRAYQHGTHVAGIAGAAGNNGKGVAGVTWQAKIMPVRVLRGYGFGREGDIIDGIEYAVANGADVINLSIAGYSAPALQDAIKKAYEAGVVVVAAAGNSGINTDSFEVFPVCADGGANMVLGVGAIGEDGEPERFSNYGRCVDVSAPGDDIVSTTPGNGYRKMTGTSMSSPAAAGVAALYLALHPGASPAEVIGRVRNGDPFQGRDEKETQEWNDRYGGYLNAAKVVGASYPDRFAPVSSPSVSPSDQPGASLDAVASPTPQPAPQPNSGGSSTSSNSGGGGGGGGGGGDQGSDPEPAPAQIVQKKPARVAGATTRKVNMALVPKINAAFRSVFGRNPNRDEHSYWLWRVQRGDKQTFGALAGTLRWYNGQGLTMGSRIVASPSSVSSGGSLISRINALHRQAYGRNPTASEHGYWMGRVVRGEKTSEAALVGAMIFHYLTGISH